MRFYIDSSHLKLIMVKVTYHHRFAIELFLFKWFYHDWETHPQRSMIFIRSNYKNLISPGPLKRRPHVLMLNKIRYIVFSSRRMVSDEFLLAIILLLLFILFYQGWPYGASSHKLLKSTISTKMWKASSLSSNKRDHITAKDRLGEFCRT